MRSREPSSETSNTSAAAVVEPTPRGETSAFLGWRMQTWPKGAVLTEVRGYGQRCDPNDPRTRPEDQLFTMDGPGVFKMARRRIRDVVRKLLTDHGFTTQDVDWVVPHQASGHGMQLVARLGFPPERIANVVGRYGNCVAAGVPMALTHIASTGQLQRGDLVLLLGTGAGLSVGAGVSASAGFGAQAGFSAGASVGTTPLTVTQSGDTLQSLSARAGADWKAVAEANGVENPRQLPPGVVVNLKVG